MYHLLRGTCLFCHRFKVSRFVLCKYVAKLRLLEHGFLIAAETLDDLRFNMTRKSKRIEDEDEEEEPAETYEAFESRVNAYVAVHLAQASSSKRDSYKDGLVYQARKDLISDFLKTAITRKCQNPNCGAHGYTFRKEGYTKIIEYDLTIKQKQQHAYIGLKRPNVLLDQQRAKSSVPSRAQDAVDVMDGSDGESESESEGEDVFSENDDVGKNTSALPKSASGKVKTTRGRNERVMAPEECRAHLRRLFANESMAEMLFEHPQNELLARVLVTSYRLRDLNDSLRAASQKSSEADDATRKRILQSLLDSLIQLQVDVNSFIDSSKNPTPIRQGRLPPAGVKQGLEKKEGLFRKHMMGKRVNYAARSVISPDVNIEPNEIGIPPVFARTLTFPEPVTPSNFHELRHMMAHKARVLHGEKTIRMHYANCNSYNADFDGDEMNIHFPQNQVARAEAMFIANTDNQYLVPTSGKPLRGLIQDHVVAGLWMTAQDTFFTREEYFQLLYGALRPEDESGHHRKQVISTVMKNITPSNFDGLNLHAQAKVPGKLWGNDSQEDKVIFLDGELLSGVLDKSAFGASEYGLVHSVYELYGADVAGKLLGILSRLFTKFLQHRAFTCRMDDLALTPDGNAKRRELLKRGAQLGTEGAMDNFPSLSDSLEEDKPAALRSLLEDVLRDDNKMAGLDMSVKSKLAKLTQSIADACIPHGLLRQFPHNHMQAMTISGAKGSNVNAQQISCALGQQELEGRRVPVMVSGKTLPSFKPFETKAIAGGYVASRFLTGVKPQEFFFHCMAGREGLIDTAVKTSRSGYLQRCLIKHLEGIRIHYDNTVRGSDSSIYQFNYGGDSLDVTKQKHLLQFEFIARNETSFVNRYKPKALQGVVSEEAQEYMKKIIKYKDKPSKRDKYMPTISKYSPSRYLGSTSEKFAEKVDEYIKRNPQRLIKEKGQDEGDLPIKKRKPPLSAKLFRLLMEVKYMRSLVEPGEAVGLLASQGVGEPSTQMTLNTFHFAGHGAANVTLGIPRLREIVMTASTKPKTPSMTMKLVVNGEARSKEFIVNLAFYPRRNISQKSELGKGRAVRERSGVAAGGDDGEGEGDDGVTRRKDDDEVSEIGDGDATSAKRKRQTKEQATYEDDDEDEDDGTGELDEADIEAAYASSEDEAGEDQSEPEHWRQEELDFVEGLFMENLPSATSFTFRDSGCTIGLQFGSSMPKLLLVGLVERICVKTVIREIPGITDCFKSKEDDENGEPSYTLTTNGSNIPGLWHFACGDGESMIDEDGIYSNDVYALLCAYGVEAARAAILREIGGVFAVYKIDVDIRHLELIADYMTFDGGYRPFNRKAFLSDATLHGDFDDLTTPSGNIVMGRISLTGTGVFDVVTSVEQEKR
ncbi:DNA-directed RNA polymerase I subunit rpa1 [Grifola frondosa]|uniref:DNA-directed RNA polymerase n=1 Tax=Grifola frondosa TaxID=5627 RepID=A0A1C7MIQ6_GRIFR|nr:DNA-directed RNA polymerase I subunit rpa1 [Grifola frondosa]